MRTCLILIVAAAAAASASSARGNPLYDDLNSLERETVDRTLEQLGLTMEPSPEGKIFAQVIVVSLEVFDEDHFFSFLNVLHATTRERVVLNEVLWTEGTPWDEAVVRETVRNMRPNQNFAVVAAMPVQAADPSQVDVLLITKDTWSLRASTNLSITDGVLSYLYVNLLERNLAGLHKWVAITTTYELDTLEIGPTYLDERLGFSRLALQEEFRFIINHDTGELEGTTNFVQFGLPLYSLSREWGFNLAQFHRIDVERLFVGSQLRRCSYDRPADEWECETPDPEAETTVDFEVDQSNVEALAQALHSRGRRMKHDFGFGYGFSNRRFALVDTSLDATANAAFERDILPRSELASFIDLTYRFYEATFTTLQNFRFFAVSEDLRVGHELLTEIDLAPTFLGSDTSFVRASQLVGYTYELGGGLLSASARVGGRWQLESKELIDRFFSTAFHAATPVVGPVRFHLAGSGILRFNRQTVGRDTLGGDEGLRGFSSGQFFGESVLLGHFEVRTLPVRIWSTYLGGVIFFDAGTIYDEGDTPVFLSDVGIGLRLVIPQAQRFAYRADYAFPTSGPDSFFPGVFTVGVDQVF